MTEWIYGALVIASAFLLKALIRLARHNLDVEECVGPVELTKRYMARLRGRDRGYLILITVLGIHALGVAVYFSFGWVPALFMVLISKAAIIWLGESDNRPLIGALFFGCLAVWTGIVLS